MRTAMALKFEIRIAMQGYGRKDYGYKRAAS